MESHYFLISSKAHRFLLGFLILILVDLFWVSSSELLKIVYVHEKYEKPFFCIYFKSSFFMLYLLGVTLWSPWRKHYSQTTNYTFLENECDDSIYNEEVTYNLSTPIFVPVKTTDISESSTIAGDITTKKAVTFNTLVEVRQMSESEASEALLARLSYQASLRLNEITEASSSKISATEIAKIAFLFCLLWFIAHYLYQLALAKTDMGTLNVVSSTSSLFTLILASIFSSDLSDRSTISKFVVVLLNIFGIVLVNYSHISLDTYFPMGVIFAVLSAFTCSCYLVYVKKKVETEEKIDIPLFFGFVGFYGVVLLWPIFFFLHFSGIEIFELPTRDQAVFLLLNGVMGTVISETIWLWGCFCTSSLVASMALSLTIPLSLLADIVMMRTAISYIFIIGSLTVLFSFLAISLIQYKNNWDPIKCLLRCAYSKIFRRTRFTRFSEYSSEQTEALISINSDEHEI